VHIMCDPDFVDNIREARQQMVLKSNGGKLPINEVANFEGFEQEMWISRDAMTNILSFSLVKSEYDITYDGDSFIVHRAAKCYSDMVFKPHKSGLHVYDPDDPRGLASYSFMETAESNMALFTKRQIHGANLACNLQAGLAFPSNPDMKWAIQSNLIKDCPVTIKDMGMAIKVWGPNIAMLKGKTVRAMPPVVRQDVIEIPKQIMSGEVMHYIFFAMGFGRYCHIHEEDQPRNNLAARTQGAISLGPSGNAQGGHKFFTLTTGKVVV
jgi:hypothetical protein